MAINVPGGNFVTRARRPVQELNTVLGTNPEQVHLRATREETMWISVLAISIAGSIGCCIAATLLQKVSERSALHG
jgi:hypothetical protein